MMEKLVTWALTYRFIVLLATLIVVVTGLYSLQRLPIDAVPDITPNQVLVLTRAPSLSPIEVEKFLTFPVETAMSGLPGVDKIQSVSKFGLSYVAVYFKENMPRATAALSSSDNLAKSKALPGATPI